MIKTRLLKTKDLKTQVSYLLKDNTIEFLVSVKPFLEAENLADLKYIRYPSSDGAEIAAYVHIPKGKDPYQLLLTADHLLMKL